MNCNNSVQSLYEISLSIGNTLDLKENNKHFLRALSRFPLIESITFYHHGIENYVWMMQSPDSELVLMPFTASDHINALFKDEKLIHLNSKEFQETSANQLINQDLDNYLFDLDGMGFILLGFTSNEKAIDQELLIHFQALIHKFGLSLRAAQAYEKSQSEKKERKRIQEELELSEEKYKIVVDNIAEGLMITDLEDNLIFINAQMCALAGCQKSDVMGKKVKEAFVPEAYWDEYDQKTLSRKRGQSDQYEISLKHSDGKQWYAFINASPYKNKEGKVIGTIGAVIDISNRKENEDALLKAKRAAEKARNIERQFLAHMSHEIRTPMNAVIGMTYLLKNTSIDAEQKEYLDALQFSADSLMDIISDILDLSKIDAEEIEFENRPFSLHQMLSSLQKTYELKVSSKNIKVEINVDPAIKTQLVGDRTRLNQILGNLLNNSSKFTNEGSIGINVVLEKVDKKQNWINFQVYDTGIGIEEADQQKVFESFKQADVDTHRKYGGTGLGLSIVKQLVELQHGYLRLKSEKGVGTMFEVIMPFGDSGVESSIHTEDQDLFRGVENEISALNILIAEDNEINQKLISSIFGQWNISFDLVDNGVLALEQANKKHYDIIFMDVNMPVMNGLQALNQLKSDESNLNFNTPVIALTAAALLEEKRKMFEAGVVDFITKPFSPTQLQQIILNCLQINTFAAENVVSEVKHISASQHDLGHQAPAFDLQQLKKFGKNNPFFIQEMLEMFLTLVPRYIQEMELFAENQLFDQVKDRAHQLKSIFATLAMNEAQRISSALEHSCNEPKINQAEIKSSVFRLTKMMNNLYPVIEKELSSSMIRI